MQQIVTRKVKAKKRPVAPKPHMVRRQILVGVGIVVLLTVLVSGIYYGTRVEAKQITSVRIVGGETIPHMEIERVVFETIRGSYYRLVPRTFVWTYPHDEIVENISRIDRVKQVSVERQRQELVVAFAEHIPQALWCTDADDGCLLIDRAGFAFANAPTLSGSAFVRFAEAGRRPEKQSTAFSSEFMRENLDFVADLQRELGLYVTHILVSGDYDVDYKVAGGGRIKVSQTMPLSVSLQNLRTILTSDQFVHLEPGKFQYIDLRFGDKVFVNEELPSASPATSTASTSDTVTE